jgi:hypothetical protein
LLIISTKEAQSVDILQRLDDVSAGYAGDLSELSAKVMELTGQQQELLHLATTNTHSQDINQARESSCK